MERSLLNILGVSILVIIIISLTLSLSGLIPGRLGDFIIMGSSLVIAIVIFVVFRIKRKKE